MIYLSDYSSLIGLWLAYLISIILCYSLPAANDSVRRHKHIHVGLTKTSLFWTLADSPAPVIISLRLKLFVTEGDNSIKQKTYDRK